MSIILALLNNIISECQLSGIISEQIVTLNDASNFFFLDGSYPFDRIIMLCYVTEVF